MTELIIQYDHNVSREISGLNNANIRVVAKLFLNTSNPGLSIGWVIGYDFSELSLNRAQETKLNEDIRWSAKDLAVTLAEDLQPSTTIINSDGNLINLVA